MRKTLTITDVTEMRDDEVCIAGIDDVGFCVRPVVPGGVRLHHLYNRGSAVVVPGRNVEFDLFEAKIEPPHIEDERFFPSSIVDKGRCTPHEWENVLAGSCSSDVSEVFDGHIVGGRYVPPRTQTRSLGTVEGVAVEYVRIFDDPDRRRYRISFQDASGKRYLDRPVNDLTFRAMMSRSLDAIGDPIEVEESLMDALRSVDRIYLRLGLTRPWGDPEYCWTQVTGIYTFPDYLEGSTFAHFIPTPDTAAR